MLISPNIKAVCFDAFGTLVEITDKRRPYRQMLNLMDTQSSSALRDRVMREPMALEDCITNFAPQMPSGTKHELEQALLEELASIRLRPHITELWAYLKQNGYKVAICSNLALPYGSALLKLLPAKADEIIMSYETGFIKPEPEIYRMVCDQLGLPPHNILFIGDTELADVTGPRDFGMEAELIDTFVALFIESNGA